MANCTKKLFQIAEAARACGLSRSTLLRMEEKGLVERTVSGADARQRLVALTPAGLEREEQVKQCFLDAETLIARGLTKEEAETLRGLLERVIHNLEEDRTV